MKEIYSNTKVTTKNIYLVKVQYIYTALKKEPTLLQCTNNKCSFAIILFLFFVLEIGILHKHSIYLNKFTVLFAIQPMEIYFSTNLQQKMKKFSFS